MLFAGFLHRLGIDIADGRQPDPGHIAQNITISLPHATDADYAKTQTCYFFSFAHLITLVYSGYFPPETDQPMAEGC